MKDLQTLQVELEATFSNLVESSRETLEEFKKISEQLGQLYQQNAELIKTQTETLMVTDQATGVIVPADKIQNKIQKSLENITQELAETNTEISALNTRLMELGLFSPKNSALKQSKVLNQNINSLAQVNSESKRAVIKALSEINKHATISAITSPVGVTQAKIHDEFETVLRELQEKNLKLREQLKQQKNVVNQITPENENTSPKNKR